LRSGELKNPRSVFTLCFCYPIVNEITTLHSGLSAFNASVLRKPSTLEALTLQTDSNSFLNRADIQALAWLIHKPCDFTAKCEAAIRPEVRILWSWCQPVPVWILARFAEAHLAMPTFLRASTLLGDAERLQRTRLAIRGIACWTRNDYSLGIAYSGWFNGVDYRLSCRN